MSHKSHMGVRNKERLKLFTHGEIVEVSCHDPAFISSSEENSLGFLEPCLGNIHTIEARNVVEHTFIKPSSIQIKKYINKRRYNLLNQVEILNVNYMWETSA